MCGIFGILYKNKIITKLNYYNILNNLKNRGPDNFGKIIYKNFEGIHSILTIQDTTLNSVQPFEYNNKILMFNGEIYNYKDLMNEYNINSNSDTELIIKLYDINKKFFLENIINRFEGIYAFLIIDKEVDEIYIVRDSFGVKPMYYINNDDYICFSSTQKNLIEINNDIDLNINGIIEHFYFRQQINNKSIIKDINSIEPGTYIKIRIENNEIEKVKYFNLFDNIKKEEDLRELLNKSIISNLISDKNVKIGCFLSGGVDSSYITSICSKIIKIYSYSIGFEDNNEFEYANIVVNKCNIKNHKNIIIDFKKYFDTMIDLINYKGSLLNVPNEVLISIISEEAKNDGIKILLSGEGSDEIFHGYNRIFKSYNNYDINKSFIDNFLEQYKYIKNKNIFKIDKNILDYIDNNVRLFFEKIYEEVKDKYPQDIISYIFLKFHIKSLLERLDNATMYNNIEGRVPFLTQSLVKHVMNNIHYEDKIKKDIHTSEEISKYIFKKISEDELDKQIIYRKKIGFEVPIENINNKFIHDLIKKILITGSILKYNIIDVEHINKLIDKKCSELKYIIFNLINIEIFIQLFIERQNINNVKEYILTNNPKKIIGYTCGVYDLFHVGHLNLFKKAKSLCDHLIVAVTIDELVTYKGKQAYINYENRSEIVENCKYVDTVIAQTNHDKFLAWKKLKYDILFVGDDWYDDPKWNDFESKLKEVGVKIIYLNYTNNISSTILRNKLLFK